MPAAERSSQPAPTFVLTKTPELAVKSPLIRAEGLTDLDIRHGVHETAKKVRRRMLRLRGSLQLPNLSGRHVFLVDDGLASGYTMLTAIESVRRLEPASVMVAVPTGHAKAVEDVDAVIVPLLATLLEIRSTRALSHEQLRQ